MKSLRCFFLLPLLVGAIVPGASAAEAIWTISMRDLGTTLPERIYGPVNEVDFFFPLPVRQFDPARASFDLTFQTSKRIAPQCSIEIYANDALIEQQLIDPGQLVNVEKNLAALDPALLSGDYLKISARIALRRANTDDYDRCEDLITREMWVDVLPQSSVSIPFDDQNPDWVTVSRLPVTLQRRLSFDLEAATGKVQRDLLLKALSWAFFVTQRPHALNESGQLVQTKSGTDRFVVSPPGDETEAGIRVESNGINRTIYLRASTMDQSREVWELLEEMSESRMPGARIQLLGMPEGSLLDQTRSSYRIAQLEPTFTDYNAGIGDISREFGFDTALFAEGDVDLQLQIQGQHTPVSRAGSALLLIYLNERLLHTQELKVGSDAIDVDVLMRREQLQEENLVRFTVAYFPTEAECKNPLFYFAYQLSDSSTISLASKGGAFGKIYDLTRMARRYFGRDRYYVALAADNDFSAWQTAAHAVAWIQRLNTRRLCQPEYFDGALPPLDSPSLIFGMDKALERDMTGWRILPLLKKNGEFKLESLEGKELFELVNDTTVGFLQAAYNQENEPVIFFDSWGVRGPEALSRVVQEMAAQPFQGQGDLLIGDGLTPTFSFETRDMVVQSGQTTLLPRGQQWKAARYWILIPLWIGISVLMIWILRQAIQRAKAA